MERVRLTESEEPLRLSGIFFDRLDGFLQQVKEWPILTRPLQAFERYYLIYSKDQESPLAKKGLSPVFPLISPFFVDSWFLFVESESKKVVYRFNQFPEELGEKDIEDIKRMFIESLALAEDPYFSPLKALDKRAIFGAFKIFSTIYSDFNITEEKGKRTLKEEECDFLGKKVKVKPSYFEEEINRFFQIADVILQKGFFSSLITDETSSVNEALVKTVLQTKESEGISDNFKTMVKYIFNQFGKRFSFFADLFSDKTLNLSEFWLKTQAMRYLAELHLSEGLKEKFIGAVDAVLKKIEQRLNEGEKVRRRNEVYFEHFINNPQDENAKSAKKLFLSVLFPLSNLEAESLKEFSFEDVLAKLFQGLDRQRIIYEIATGRLVIQSKDITNLTSTLLRQLGIDDNLSDRFLSFIRKKHNQENAGFFLTANQFLGDFLEFLGREIKNAYEDYPEPFYVFFVVNYYAKSLQKLSTDPEESAKLFDFDKIKNLGEINIWEVLKLTVDLIRGQPVRKDSDQEELFSIEEIQKRLIELGHNPFTVEEVVAYVFHLLTTFTRLPIKDLRLFKPENEGQAYTGAKNLFIQGPSGTGKTRLIKELMEKFEDESFYTISLNGSALVVEPYKGLTFRQALANLIKKISEEKAISLDEAIVHLQSCGAIIVVDEVDNLLAIRIKKGADDESRIATAKDFNILLDTTSQEIVFEMDGKTFTISTENLYFILLGSFSDVDIAELIRLQLGLLSLNFPVVKTPDDYCRYTKQIIAALEMIISPDLMRRLLVVPVPEPNLGIIKIYTANLLNSLWTEIQRFLRIRGISPREIPNAQEKRREISDKEKEDIKKLTEFIFKNRLYPKLGDVYTRALMHLKAFLEKGEFEGDLFQLVLREVSQQLQTYR